MTSFIKSIRSPAAACSPAFNAADPTFLPNDAFDLDGDNDTAETVPYDGRGAGFDRISDGSADRGAYELQLLSFVSPDTASVPENTQPVQTLSAFAGAGPAFEYSLFGQAPAGELGPGQTLSGGERIDSPDGQARLVMQFDGNLVVYTNGIATWASGTNGASNATATIQPDGNLVITDDGGGGVLYQSNSGGNSGAFARLRVNNAGFPEIVRVDGEILWQGALNQFSGQGTTLTPEPLAPAFAKAADTDLFEIVSGDQLQFVAPPDFENPGDADADNVYEVTVLADDGAGNITVQTIRVTVTDTTERFLFYNDSSFDSVSDEDAIADKTALLSGETSAPSNFTSYVRGINGLMVDLVFADNLNAIGPADFGFRTGRTNDTDAWTTVLVAPTITVRPGEGVDGTNRIVLSWPSGTITDTWLEVTVKANQNTGLADDDVFYFGNQIGDVNGDGLTNASDFQAVRANPANFLDPAYVDNAFDINRDGRVNAVDRMIVRDHATTIADALPMISPMNSATDLTLPAVIEKQTPPAEEDQTSGDKLAVIDETGDDAIRYSALLAVMAEANEMASTGKVSDEEGEEELIVLALEDMLR